MEDKEIIDLYIARSEKAISETDVKYGAYCRKIANNILADICETDECVNDTYFNMWKAIPPTIPKMLKTFVGKVTRNIALNKYEKKKAQKRSNGQVELSLDELSECFDAQGNVEKKIENKETVNALNEFLASLDRNKRIYFMQRYWYFTPIKEIAEQNNISEGSLKTTLCRIRKDLKVFLSEKGLY